ncbi:hypothetical protein [Streptomyces sp. NBC_01716]|uniref:hypothetical protein n=1 Tax=Streptomyces sp. NBC_01716 TaxID=2975917 RepID=UPI002E2F59EF|nr:hypothetical protein [Streptomyces sp. NBC_01716]
MRLSRTTITLAVALATAAGLASPAQAETSAAAGASVDVSASYAYGKAGWNWRFDRLEPLTLAVRDDAADGHSVTIQLVTISTAGKRYWPMRRVSTGKGTGETWSTYAIPGGFPQEAWIRICQMEGSTILQCKESAHRKTTINDN